MNAPSNIGIVNVHDAKTNFSRLLERAHAGEEIVIAKAGRPYAMLVPLPRQANEPRRPGRWRGLVGAMPDSAWFEPLPEDERALWEGRHKDLS